MLGRERILDIVRRAVEYSNADQTQAAVEVGESSLTRFANSMIHQNVSERNGGLAVKAIVGKRIGYAVTNKLDDASVRAVVEKACTFARNSGENPDFVSLPKPKPITEADTWDERTAAYAPEDRACAVGGLIDEGRKRGASAAGLLSNGYAENAIVSSLGVEAYTADTVAKMQTVMTADDGFGYADRVARSIGDFDTVEAGIEAADRSVQAKNPLGIDPGEYDVILLPYATGDLLEYLSWLGFGALAVQEGRSFMKLGEKILGDNISIWDDGLDPRGVPSAFDPEGVPKQRVDLIVNGVAKGIVYDSYTAHKEGKESTGHSSGGVGTYGPFASNMFMQPGEHTLDEMIAGTKYGVLVTRFHYSNVIHPTQVLITGMTRDGTFLIEDGRITKPLKNMRFTDSVLRILQNTDMISRDLMRQQAAVVPAIRAKGFRFSGATEF